MTEPAGKQGIFNDDGPPPLDRLGIREGLVDIAERLGQSYHLAVLMTTERESPHAEKLLALIFEGIRDVERLASRVPEDEEPDPEERASRPLRAIRALLATVKREGEEARKGRGA